MAAADGPDDMNPRTVISKSESSKGQSTSPLSNNTNLACSNSASTRPGAEIAKGLGAPGGDRASLLIHASQSSPGVYVKSLHASSWKTRSLRGNSTEILR